MQKRGKCDSQAAMKLKDNCSACVDLRNHFCRFEVKAIIYP